MANLIKLKSFKDKYVVVDISRIIICLPRDDILVIKLKSDDMEGIYSFELPYLEENISVSSISPLTNVKFTTGLSHPVSQIKDCLSLNA